MNRKTTLLSFASLFILASMLSTASAETLTQNSLRSYAVGAGVFNMQMEGEIHKHYFAFSVSENLDHSFFNLVCIHNREICMIVKSDEITSFQVEPVQGGLSAMFSGTARVKMHGGEWEDGWTFTVTAFDYGMKGKGVDRLILELSNSEEHHMEGTLTAGNIIIKG